jgi:hypothetical protein
MADGGHADYSKFLVVLGVLASRLYLLTWKYYIKALKVKVYY